MSDLGLDLSAVRLIFNGAEPISLDLCEQFLTRLAAARNCHAQSMYPVYGLAEASLAVSFPPLGTAVQSISLNRHRMTVGTAPPFVTRADPDAVSLVGVGCADSLLPAARDRQRMMRRGPMGRSAICRSVART